jgi:alpha-1,6-mannosyltransferase
MRIVRLANYVAPNSGGLRTSLRELGAGYLAAGHEPVLIIPGERDSDEQTPQGRVITLPGLRLPFTGGYRAMLRKRRVAALLGELRPDTLEVSDRTTLRWTGRWAREHGVPAVMISHESLTALMRMAVPGLDLPALTRWGPALALVDAVNRRTARAYRHVICTTAWAAAEFERIGIGNLLRAPLGVDLTTFAPPHNKGPHRDKPCRHEPCRHEPCRHEPCHHEQGKRVRDAYAAPGETLLVHCGRLSPEKKPQRSLNTLATLRAKGLSARLVVAGDGPLRRRLERRAARDALPVTFAGFLPDRSDLAALLASADVAIAPGPAETFGLAGLEALACGTPVVVSAESALPEVVGEAGSSVAGEDLSAGVITVLSWPEPQRRAAARARAEQFGWPAAVQAFLAVHDALLADGGLADGGLADGGLADGVEASAKAGSVK